MKETTTQKEIAMHLVLIGGLWLGGSAWDAVVYELEAMGHSATAVTLPGQGDRTITAALDDHVTSVVAAIDAAPGSVVLVGHSAAASLAWAAADARPTSVDSVVFIGGFPVADGEAYADSFEVEDGFVRFPGWETFEGPDSADLDDETKERIAGGMWPVPEGVALGVVHLRDPRRYDIPCVLVCPEFSPAQARQWIDGGDAPELAAIKTLELVDLDSGHWPMFSQPRRLAELLTGTRG